jgi:hypothetical protein
VSVTCSIDISEQCVTPLTFRSVSYIQSFYELSQQRLNSMCFQTLTSLRDGMTIFNTQSNSLRDYCGEMTELPSIPHHSLYQQQHSSDSHYPLALTTSSYGMRPTVAQPMENVRSPEEDPSMLYVGHTLPTLSTGASILGQLSWATDSVSLAMDNFQTGFISCSTDETENSPLRGCISTGIGTFHDQTRS